MDPSFESTVRDFDIQPGCYRFHQKPLQILGFRRRARKKGFETKVDPAPHGRIHVFVWRPGAPPESEPSYAVFPDGDLIREGAWPDGTERYAE